ncbi:hypothetical protein ABZ816_37240 [Actinosynnema sp. NPDC047251]|uniref:Nitroreductase domain-containing protein n=1 Tax=Saccharothrix espanaensis (strain ATCC 51144 / DSM 44229 / JCM 9112 / NBRC 15066 / NRRL 15764) TaxID=1179773 RepID=K0K301_SACES|nr:hypothetical protein [Saccharothrix espanaensis]CCH32676.1 hypothetical protein BN6_54170 [Saccharothrix espanaensis DSM 44229]
MIADDTAPAVDRYLRLTFDRMADVVPRGLPAEFPPWRRDTGTPSWVRRLPPVDVDPAVDWSGGGGARAGLTAAALAALLAHGAGASAVELGPQSAWRHHRVVPSARCVHPCSVWVVGGDGPAGAPDVARYFPEHHQLRSAAPPRHRRWTRTGLVISAAVGTIGAHYGEYAYRLVCQEAGLLAESLLLTARALGLVGAFDTDSTAAELDGLLGLDGARESALLMIRLTGGVVDLAAARPVAHVRAPPLPADRRGRALGRGGAPAVRLDHHARAGGAPRTARRRAGAVARAVAPGAPRSGFGRSGVHPVAGVPGPRPARAAGLGRAHDIVPGDVGRRAGAVRAHRRRERPGSRRRPLRRHDVLGR